ncbi:hypothetical protein [Bradyrhizobium sp. ORS 375]|uniref:hypothetical protein n=1 Tax=Bradyrhizobium sp. (strain ORS 375) TaxID=566679 RepID=UPI00111208B0|nr:hypothetical protein [Bradyrhizobium sp. ORS 375]
MLENAAHAAVSGALRILCVIFDGCGSTRLLARNARHTFVRLSPWFCAHWPWSGPNDATKPNKSSCGATRWRCHHQHADCDDGAEDDHGDGGKTWTVIFAHQLEKRDHHSLSAGSMRSFNERACSVFWSVALRRWSNKPGEGKAASFRAIRATRHRPGAQQLTIMDVIQGGASYRSVATGGMEDGVVDAEVRRKSCH